MNFYRSLVLFLFLFDPWFFGVIRAGMLSVFLCLPALKKISFSTNELKKFIIIIFFTILSLLPALIYGTFEIGPFLMYVKLSLYFVAALLVYKLLFVNIKLTDLTRLLGYVFIAQCLFLLLCLFNFPGFRDIAFLSHSRVGIFFSSEQEYRFYFITSGVFFQLAIFFGFMFHLLFALYKEKKHNNIILLIAIFVCGMASGRVFMLFALFTFICYGLDKKSLIAGSMLGFIILYMATNLSDNRYVKHALEPVIRLVQNHELETSSSDDLVENHLFIPTEKQIFIGDGKYYNADGSYYMKTDSGFIRQVLYGGILYLLSCIGVFLFFLKSVSERWINNSNKFFITSTFIFMVSHVKADVFMFPGILTVSLIFFSFFKFNDR